MDRADHPRRGAHLRHGRALQPRTASTPTSASSTSRSMPRSRLGLPRGQERPDPGGGHHRGRLDVVVHRGRHGLRHPRRADDPVLHLLLDVRLPAHRRPDLGGGRHADARLPAGRHGRPHDAHRRGLAAPGRPQPRPRLDGAEPGGLRSGLRLRAGRHRPGRHPPHVRGQARTSSTTSRCTTRTTRCCRCPRVRPRASSRGCTSCGRRAAQGERRATPKVHLLGSGPILPQALRAQEMLAEQFGVAADVWSVTSYKELRREALEVERWNMLHPTEKPRQSYVETAAGQGEGRLRGGQRLHEGRCRR